MSDLQDEIPTPEPPATSPEPAVHEPAEPEAPAAEASADSQESSEESATEPETAAEPESAAEPQVAAESEETAEPQRVAEALGAAAEEDVEPEVSEPEAVAEPEPEAAAEPEALEAAAEPEAAEAAAEPEAAEAAAEPEAAEPEAAAAEPETAEAAAEPEAAEAAAGPEAESAAASEPESAAEPAAAATAETPSDEAAEPSAATAVSSSPELAGAMAELEAARQEKTLVKGQVIGWNKGGYHVAIGKIAAFCPVSQIEIGNPRGPKRYLDKTFDFRVIEIQKGGRRVVLSRSEALTAEREQKAALVRELLKPGAVVEGKISSLTDFGAFVDLGGGIEGLVHVSEISRRRVEHPKEVLKTRQPVKVSVLKIEKGGQRISLSMKRLEPDPWKGVAERFPPGSEFTGTIVRQTDFGLFVEVAPGLEGLVHTSRLGLGQTLDSEELQAGQEVGGWVHEVERKRRRLSLSLRQVAGGNPWQGVADRYPVGDVVKGRVERLASFGAFIELEPGLTGLLPFSVLGTGPGSNPRRQYHAGKEVSVRVMSIDRAKKRISLGTEASKAEGNQQDYREYQKTQRTSSSSSSSSSGLNAMAAAFAKLKEQERAQ